MKQYDYPQLVVKRLMGTISLEESEALNRWLMASRENRRIYMDIKRSLNHKEPPETPEAQELLMRKSEYFSPRSGRGKQSSGEENRRSGILKRMLGVLLPSRRIRPTYRAFLIVIFAMAMIHIYQGRLFWKQTVEIETTVTERRELALGEGSEVLLGSRSRLKYHPDFSDTLRVVYLHGEAKFRVAPDADRPFLVVGGSVLVLTEAATFYLHVADTLTLLQVGEGKVSFQAGANGNGPATLVAAGQMVTLRPGTRPSPPQPYDPADSPRWWP